MRWTACRGYLRSAVPLALLQLATTGFPAHAQARPTPGASDANRLPAAARSDVRTRTDVPRSPGTDTTSGSLIVTGSRSSIYFSPPLLKRAEPVCIDFTISAAGAPVDSVRVTSIGVGEVIFFETDPEAARTDEGCPPQPASAGELYLLSGPVGSPRHLVARVVPEGVPKGFGSLSGEVLVYAGRKPPLRIPLAVKERPNTRFATAFLWFWGIFVPGAIAAMIGHFGKKFYDEHTAAEQQERKLRDFRVSNRESIKGLFSDFYPAISTHEPAQFSRELSEELGERGILEVLPDTDRKLLMDALDRADRNAVDRQLARLFPLHAQPPS